MAEGTGRDERFSIWFFVGILPLLYGLILVPYGLYEAMGHEAPTQTLGRVVIKAPASRLFGFHPAKALQTVSASRFSPIGCSHPR